MFNTIEEIIDDISKGKIVILLDDEDRENEGDLVCAAELVTPEIINFMASHGKGLICMPLSGEKCDQLNLPMMTNFNRASHGTGFTVSIEAASGISTGISAADRSHTILTAASNSAKSSDIVQPGHVFPLRAMDGGVLSRAGHTEAATDLSLLAGLQPSGVICEIMNDDGTMARLEDLKEFCKSNNINIATIEELIRWRVRNDPIVKIKYTDQLVTKIAGNFKFFCYSNKIDDTEHFALVKGDIEEDDEVLVRVQKLNYISDLFQGVLSKNNSYEKDVSINIIMLEMQDIKKGVIVIIKANKSIFEWNNYKKENYNSDSQEFREYGVGAQILRDIGVRKMVLLTNSKKAIIGLQGFDLKIVGHKELRNE